MKCGVTLQMQQMQADSRNLNAKQHKKIAKIEGGMCICSSGQGQDVPRQFPLKGGVSVI